MTCSPSPRRMAGSCAQLPSAVPAFARLKFPSATFRLWFAECPVKMKADYRARGELVYCS